MLQLTPSKTSVYPWVTAAYKEAAYGVMRWGPSGNFMPNVQCYHTGTLRVLYIWHDSLAQPPVRYLPYLAHRVNHDELTVEVDEDLGAGFTVGCQPR